MENSSEKQEKSPSPGVAVDGSRIRGIREEKKLTQLYVASVVGVTVDTISRWENNRYPNIKRENAEKLAAALEVALDEILRENGTAPVEPPPPPSKRSPGLRIFFALMGIAIVAAALFYFLQQPQAGPKAERFLPRFGAPGEIIPVQVSIARPEGGKYGFIVKERLPAGWRFIGSNPPTTAPSGSSNEVKWLVPSGNKLVSIYYTVAIPADPSPTDQGNFKGSIVSHNDGPSDNAAISGDSLVRVGGFHWADRNGDGRIDDDEIMPAYYLTEETKGLGLDWKTVEAIWNAGGYKWDSRRREFVVLK